MVAHGTRRLSCRTAEHRKLVRQQNARKEEEGKKKSAANSDIFFFWGSRGFKVLWPDLVPHSAGFTSVHSVGAEMPSSFTNEGAIITYLSKNK